MMKMNFGIGSDLYVAGRDEDGREFHAELFYLVAEDNSGNRWAHASTFPGCMVEDWNDEDGGSGRAFNDIRPQAQADAQALLARIQAAGGQINLDHWREMRPAYGSAAYIDYGQFDDWMDDQQERQRETGLF